MCPACTQQPNTQHANTRATALLSPQVLSIAVDVAKGLEYLHPTIVHRDLKVGQSVWMGCVYEEGVS